MARKKYNEEGVEFATLQKKLELSSKYTLEALAHFEKLKSEGLSLPPAYPLRLIHIAYAGMREIRNKKVCCPECNSLFLPAQSVKWDLSTSPKSNNELHQEISREKKSTQRPKKGVPHDKNL